MIIIDYGDQISTHDALFLAHLVFNLSAISSFRRGKLPRRNTSLIKLVQFVVSASLCLGEQKDARNEIQSACAGKEETSLLPPARILIRKHKRYSIALRRAY